MNKHIRRSKFTKFVACYLAMMILLQITAPMEAYALTEGPSQPEFNSFTPIGTSDMVDLASGDFNYNIPIMDVGGYPINLAYNSGVTMDQEASWVGLGWNLNVGQINRNVRGIPDDFKGDMIQTENNLKTNVTVGVNPYINAQLIGALDGPALMFGAGLDVQYNNYNGMSAVPSFGPSFKFSDYVSVGMQLSSSVDEGASITPSVSISTKKMDKDTEGSKFSGTLSPSVTYNSRQGLQSFNLSSSVGFQKNEKEKEVMHRGNTGASGSGSISFVNNTFTPTKRLAFKNNSFRFSFSGGPDVYGGHVELSIAGYASIQKLQSKNELQNTYGYENTQFSTESDVLDFNRENEQSTVSKNTLVLPLTNYTYDIYTIQGQGAGGTFRPFRGQVGYVFDPLVSDQSSSNSAGLEIEGGAGVHKGLNFRTSTTTSYTGNWNTVATPYFKEKTAGNEKSYENVYYKNIGEAKTDNENSTLLQVLGGSSPIALKLDQNKYAVNSYRKKELVGNQSLLSAGTIFNSQIKRAKRELRNQAIQKVTKGEAKSYGLSTYINYNTAVVPDPADAQNKIPLVKDHHTAGYIVTDESGNRTIYGETAYNIEKKEVTFNVGPATSSVSPGDGIVRYSGTDNTYNNSKGRDHYFNSVKTPPYAHTYLITSTLSPDYQDLTLNGPSEDDLGSYTKFTYQSKSNYKWRIPFKKGTASYNEGLKTDKLDQKGSYIYGVKENKYLRRIETKTHVAVIEVESRKDGVGVDNENGGGSDMTEGRMYRIKTIKLYSKKVGLRSPIKTAHFEYDYSLCGNIDNNTGSPEIVGGQDLNLKKGKLTLKKVYFTYENSNMGKYTPYVFNYSDSNPNYNVKAYDIWGNYKPFEADSWLIGSSKTTPQEFPYVDQNDRDLQNSYASSWSLVSIKLPSGGLINVDYEADDYKYVQDKKAMQMFKIHGVTNKPIEYAQSNTRLYGIPGSPEDATHVAIKLPPNTQQLTDDQIVSRYTEGLLGKPIYFNFLLNMTSSDYDYVSGYFEMDREAEIHNGFLFVPMKHVQLDGNSSGGTMANPITVAGCFFGRQNLNHQINNLPEPGGVEDFNVISIGKSIWNNLEAMSEIFTKANGRLVGMNVAKTFKPDKSWIRLLEPSGSKIGGGCRVKKIVMKDQWDKMLNLTGNMLNDLPRYAKEYGQEYDYTLDGENQGSSGVATYEPNICKENPLVMPLYHKPEKLMAQSYQEGPFGESFFPNPTVTYSKVSVKNINASGTDRTGKVVTRHFTTRDFPTITDFTNLAESKKFQTNENQAITNTLKSLLGLKINVTTDLTMSQGFVIETNDMNGKLKSQEVYNNSNSLISAVYNKYSTKADQRRLENMLPTIDETGKIETGTEIAVHYDVVNDLRESYSHVNSYGLAVNVDVLPLFIPIIIGWGTPERSENKQILRTAVTTKVIHRSGILKEKIAYDLGAKVSTKNHAWDAKTGQVILTETINEFDDKYYSFNFPAYWSYKSMGLASENLDIKGRFAAAPVIQQNGNYFFKMDGTQESLSSYLNIGDEIAMFQPSTRMWVTGFSSDGKAVSLMNADGAKITELKYPVGTGFWGPSQGVRYKLDFRVMRSAKRNQQMTSMASITLMRSPIIQSETATNVVYKGNINSSFLKTSSFDPKIISASAIEYNDYWQSQCENGLPHKSRTDINEYFYNIKGNWRPSKSYAYLTSRIEANTSTRKSGFYTSFTPFYIKSGNNWIIDPDVKEPSLTKWTYASEVTKYNPYGVEIENKDALDRYSSAQYGYKYTLPVAVSSNSTYEQMGFDNFEDYNTTSSNASRHFGFMTLSGLNPEISTQKAHTGKKSIRVLSGSPVIMKRKITECKK